MSYDGTSTTSARLGEQFGDLAAEELPRRDQPGERRAHDPVDERARAAEDQAVDLGAHGNAHAPPAAALLGAVEVAAVAAQ